MPITIQEIIASDTISQLVDKTNFNFDQLLLNGGGPAGPAGIAGPTGPAGGRGFKGTTWYEDTSTTGPGNTPIAVPPTATPLISDYYLQFNGQVWEYNGTAWVITTVDLEGPTGPAGQSGGFGDTFGSTSINFQNTRYNGPIGTVTTGANSVNQGVPAIMIGGVVSTTIPLAGFPAFDSAYEIPDAIATEITSDVASLVIHQKDSSGRSIVFQGGGAVALDKFEQGTIANLSTIKIGVNDRLISQVTKKVAVVDATAMNDLVGYVVETEFRSQSYTAGQQIRMVTGIDANVYGAALENSNFEIQVGNGAAGSGGHLFKVSTLSATTLLEMGNIPTLVTSQGTQQGKFQLQAGDTRFVTSVAKPFGVYAGSTITLNTISNVGDATGNINLQAGTGTIALTTTTGTIALTNQQRIEIRTGSGTTLYPRIDLNKITPADTISIASNANTSIALAGNEIKITATVNAVLANAGKIILGDSVNANPTTSTVPRIEMLFSSQPVTNIRGHVQYKLSGAFDNANLDPDNQAIYIDPTTSIGENIVIRVGGNGIIRQGIAPLAVQDGVLDSAAGASVYIGKSVSQAGTVLGEEQLGLYVNSGTAWTQGNANGVSPVNEKFRATSDSTKINNVLLWGGKNGGTLIQADPLTKVFTGALSTIEKITVTSPYLRIRHLSNQLSESGDYYVGTNVYSATNTAGLITADPGTDAADYEKTYEIETLTSDNDQAWYTGQRMHVEVLNFPATFVYNTGTNLNFMNQNGLIKLKIPTGKTFDVAGIGTWDYLTFDCGGPQLAYTNPVVTPVALPDYPYGNMTGAVLNAAGTIQAGRRGVVNPNDIKTATPSNNPPAGGGNPKGTRWSATFQYDGRAITVRSQSDASGAATTTSTGTYLTYTYIPGWRMVGEPQSEFIQLPQPASR